jgi:hypothetical protein
MLRRRGVPSSLTYGAKMLDGHLDAHVWVTAGTDGVVGHDVASGFSALVT